MAVSKSHSPQNKQQTTKNASVPVFLEIQDKAPADHFQNSNKTPKAISFFTLQIRLAQFRGIGFKKELELNVLYVPCRARSVAPGGA